MADKAEIIDHMAMKTGLTSAQSAEALDALLESISECLAEGQSIRFPGFGSFTVIERESRPGRDPRTGEPITILSRKEVRFKIGYELENQINP